MVAGGTGIVLASFGRSVLVQASEGLVRCDLKGRKLRVVCGDRVVWGYPPSADGPSVESVEPRRNLIERIDARGNAGGRLMDDVSGACFHRVSFANQTVLCHPISGARWSKLSEFMTVVL